MVKRKYGLKIGLGILTVFLLLAGCQKAEETPPAKIIDRIDENEYRIVIPFEFSKNRQYYGTYYGRMDIMEVGSRLIEKSKVHFSVDNYYLGEGQVLTSERLSQLVRRESSDNPYALNPPSGSDFVTGIGDAAVRDAVVVAGVTELDFYTGTATDLQLSGLSFAIVLNQVLNKDGVQYPVSPDVLFDYGSNMGRKLDRFIRSISSLEDIPIYIALFMTNPSDATLPGNYIGDAYFTSREGQFSRNDEDWELYPSSSGSSRNPEFAGLFGEYRNQIVDFVPESIGVIGEARYVDERIDYLRITLTIQAKTYVEILALTQYAAELVEGFGNRDYPIVIRVNSLTDTFSLVEISPEGDIQLVKSH